MDSPITTRKIMQNRNPGTPLKYGERKTAPRGSEMPSAPWGAPSMQSNIPLETRIWLSVFDNEPVGPYRRDELAT
eukprot:scaffold2062_cov166-Amphora_coffeaeformis.AAC.2